MIRAVSIIMFSSIAILGCRHDGGSPGSSATLAPGAGKVNKGDVLAAPSHLVTPPETGKTVPNDIVSERPLDGIDNRENLIWEHRESVWIHDQYVRVGNYPIFQQLQNRTDQEVYTIKNKKLEMVGVPRSQINEIYTSEDKLTQVFLVQNRVNQKSQVVLRDLASGLDSMIFDDMAPYWNGASGFYGGYQIYITNDRSKLISVVGGKAFVFDVTAKRLLWELRAPNRSSFIFGGQQLFLRTSPNGESPEFSLTSLDLNSGTATFRENIIDLTFHKLNGGKIGLRTNRSIKIVDAKTFVIESQIDWPDSVFVLSPDLKFAIRKNGEAVRLSDGSVIWKNDSLSNLPQDHDFSANGKFLALRRFPFENRLDIYSVTTGKQIGTVEFGCRDAKMLDLQDDGTLVTFETCEAKYSPDRSYDEYFLKVYEAKQAIRILQEKCYASKTIVAQLPSMIILKWMYSRAHEFRDRVLIFDQNRNLIGANDLESYKLTCSEEKCNGVLICREGHRGWQQNISSFRTSKDMPTKYKGNPIRIDIGLDVYDTCGDWEGWNRINIAAHYDLSDKDQILLSYSDEVKCPQ